MVFVPVEGLDFEATPLGVPTDDAGDGLVHEHGGAAGVVHQVQDLVAQVVPAPHAGELRAGVGVQGGVQEQR